MDPQQISQGRSWYSIHASLFISFNLHNENLSFYLRNLFYAPMNCNSTGTSFFHNNWLEGEIFLTQE